jgi:hypothetical protein
MTAIDTYQQPTVQGYYGDFGGIHSEMLHGNVEELRSVYLDIISILLSGGI